MPCEAQRRRVRRWGGVADISRAVCCGWLMCVIVHEGVHECERGVIWSGGLGGDWCDDGGRLEVRQQSQSMEAPAPHESGIQSKPTLSSQRELRNLPRHHVAAGASLCAPRAHGCSALAHAAKCTLPCGTAVPACSTVGVSGMVRLQGVPQAHCATLSAAGVAHPQW